MSGKEQWNIIERKGDFILPFETKIEKIVKHF